jgi:hypothetical protein
MYQSEDGMGFFYIVFPTYLADMIRLEQIEDCLLTKPVCPRFYAIHVNYRTR